jgi:hypothetical protein
MNVRPFRSALPRIALAASACALAACIHPPPVVLLDRKTVLEEQAGGELHALETELRDEAIVPRGAELTRAELEEAGGDLSESTLATIVQIHGVLRSEGTYLDELLVRRCIGEAYSGLLVETPETCQGRVPAGRLSASVQRVNRTRRQLWRHLHAQRPTATEDELRAAWRRHHLEGVVCGGWIQREDGAWEAKSCRD